MDHKLKIATWAQIVPENGRGPRSPRLRRWLTVPNWPTFWRKRWCSAIRSDASLDRTFVKAGEPGGEHLRDLLVTGRVPPPAGAPLRPAFNLALILRKAGLGMREAVRCRRRSIWLCSACDKCYGRPKEIHISDVMGAIRAIAIREGYQRPGAVAAVDVARCVACGMCQAVCPYEAVTLQEVTWNRRTRTAAQVDASACMGCGICSAVCPSVSISVPGQADAQVHADLAGRGLAQVPEGGWQGKVLVLACNWCTHTEADARAAAESLPGVEIIRVACAGRVSPLMVMAGLQMGASAVLVVGCGEGECHYKQGSALEEGRLAVLQSCWRLWGCRRSAQFYRLGSLERGRFGELVTNAAESASEPVPRRGTSEGGSDRGRATEWRTRAGGGARRAPAGP